MNKTYLGLSTKVWIGVLALGVAIFIYVRHRSATPTQHTSTDATDDSQLGSDIAAQVAATLGGQPQGDTGGFDTAWLADLINQNAQSLQDYLANAIGAASGGVTAVGGGGGGTAPDGSAAPDTAVLPPSTNTAVVAPSLAAPSAPVTLADYFNAYEQQFTSPSGFVPTAAAPYDASSQGFMGAPLPFNSDAVAGGTNGGITPVATSADILYSPSVQGIDTVQSGADVGTVQIPIAGQSIPYTGYTQAPVAVNEQTGQIQGGIIPPIDYVLGQGQPVLEHATDYPSVISTPAYSPDPNNYQNALAYAAKSPSTPVAI